MFIISSFNYFNSVVVYCLGIIIYHFGNILFFIVNGITTGKSIIAITGGKSDNFKFYYFNYFYLQIENFKS